MNEPEPWLRGTLTNVPPVQRAVLHALELAREDLRRWCATLNDEQLNARPLGLAPIAFHIRHIARSIDRLLTYAEGKPLSEAQLAALRTELDGGATREELFRELAARLWMICSRSRKARSTTPGCTGVWTGFCRTRRSWSSISNNVTVSCSGRSSMCCSMT